LGEVEAFPCGQQEQLLVPRWKLLKRVGQHPSIRHVNRRGLRHAPDLLGERLGSSRAPALVGHHPSGTAKQPWQRILRNILQATTRDHEHLHHHVIGNAGIRSPSGIRMDRARVTAVQMLDALALFCLHTNIMSGETPVFTPTR
jgi:hypothetical protein